MTVVTIACPFCDGTRRETYYSPHGIARRGQDRSCPDCKGSGQQKRCAPDRWKGNKHHMLIAGSGCEPDHDPPEAGCESCGYLDESGVEHTDLAWANAPAWSPGQGQWLCMECH